MSVLINVCFWTTAEFCCVLLRADGDRLLARVEVPGVLHPGKGINLPDTLLSIPALTERDREALRVAARSEVDWLALSFVRSADAAEELRVAAEEVGLKVPVLAKIEPPRGGAAPP